MRSFNELRHLPQFSGIYAFKGINDRSGMYSYIGMASQLRDRVSQHLIRRDSSVTTGASTVALNPDKISECHWWGGGYSCFLRIQNGGFHVYDGDEYPGYYVCEKSR